jgi:hypothetical protein
MTIVLIPSVGLAVALLGVQFADRPLACSAEKTEGK